MRFDSIITILFIIIIIQLQASVVTKILSDAAMENAFPWFLNVMEYQTAAMVKMKKIVHFQRAVRIGGVLAIRIMEYITQV